jgi:hypothetical protein
MKYLIFTLLSIIWLLLTLILAMTIFGIIVFFIENKDDEIYWFAYGRKLLDNLIN